VHAILQMASCRWHAAALHMRKSFRYRVAWHVCGLAQQRLQKGVSTALATCHTHRGADVDGCSWPCQLHQWQAPLNYTIYKSGYIKLLSATSSYRLRWCGMVSPETGYKLRVLHFCVQLVLLAKAGLATSYS
jgi:hypothetical protein